MGVGNREILVDAILEHHEGDENWTVKVPLIEGCLAEVSDPKEAAEAIVPEIQYFLRHQPGLLETLQKPPEIRLTKVRVPLEETTT